MTPIIQAQALTRRDGDFLAVTLFILGQNIVREMFAFKVMRVGVNSEFLQTCKLFTPRLHNCV